MREILFRGKSIEADEWVYGNLDTFKRKVGGIGCGIFDDDKGVDCGVLVETVGQYTGTLDKNGKKIFEGDICRGKNEYTCKNEIFSIIFKDGAFRLKLLSPVMPKFHYACVYDGLISRIQLEVIGNIHDNPELEFLEG